MTQVCICFLTILIYGNLFRVHASLLHKPPREYYENIIQDVNKAGATWKAGLNFDGFNLDKLSHLLGSLKTTDDDRSDCSDLDYLSHKPNSPSEEEIDEFDARLKWPQCPSIGRIPNQGNCAADWVIAPVNAISDRICIATNGSVQVAISSHEPLSCCKSCGYGCRKGYPLMVYDRYVTKGLVTGGEYKSKKGCQPYDVAPCNNYKECSFGANGKTPSCKPYCYNSAYKKKYKDDAHKGYGTFRVGCPCSVAPKELAMNGPFTAMMMVYEDFLTYKSGIYNHVSGKRLGHLTVKIIGYNFTDEKSMYWIAINSWGRKWGDDGTFKIQFDAAGALLEGGMRGAWVKRPSKGNSN